MPDFDRVIERRGTHASKWDMMAKLSGIHGGGRHPDVGRGHGFRRAPGRDRSAERATVDRGVHGYYADTGSWAEALADWLARRHDVSIDPAWVSPTPGVVAGLGLILQAVTEPGDEVVVFPPAYHAFRKIILANDRRILDAQLVAAPGPLCDGPRRAARKLTPRTKIVFFCSPHNPGGTVWSAGGNPRARGLLRRTQSDFGVRRNPLRPGVRRRQAYADPRRRARNRRSPDHLRRRDQNLQSRRRPCRRLRHVQCRDLKQRIDARIAASGLGSYNAFGMIATEAAWRTGEAWLDELLPYLAGNRDLLDTADRGGRARRAFDAARRHLSGLGEFFRHRAASRTTSPSGSADRARIFASPGPQFGPGGETWLRFNFATPRPILDEALDRLDDAFRDIRG